MVFLSSRMHGMIDYATGLALIAAPWLFGFADQGPATWVPVLCGVVMIVQALITNYEYSLAKLIALPAHLIMDITMGALLAASPWVFGFADAVYLPHMLIGLAEIAVALVTVKEPYRMRNLVETTTLSF